jgi:opacity protein-like surface antigen
MALRKLAFSLALVMSLAGSAAAADLAPAEEPVAADGGWTFTFAPYLWAAGMQGDIAQFGLPEVDVDLTFSDIMKNFDVGVMGVGEARHDRFGILTDLLYVKLSAGNSVDPRGPIDADVRLMTETFTFLGAGEYRLIDDEAGSLDALAGARLWWVGTDFDFSGNAINASADDSETWVDPIIGLRGRLNLSPDFFLTSWGMIGGFGVSSDFTWDVMGGLGYQASDSISLVAGYRAMGVDYRNDGFVFDVTQDGPILGAVFRF